MLDIASQPTGVVGRAACEVLHARRTGAGVSQASLWERLGSRQPSRSEVTKVVLI